ncbi:MAG: DUF2857 domain-containing protein [Gammaproteobacteria bacterium]|nr:DUF2857 domain-containing protein [Gammaproteobacteria bacterium]
MSICTKESDLVTAVLMYALRCLSEGDQAALRNMNFGPTEIEALRAMTLSDLYRVESLRAHCLRIRLDRQVYWPMVDNLQRQRQSEETQHNLIAADAPLEMMQMLFGFNAREYSRLRRSMSVDPVVGRPPEPDEATSHTLWAAWVARIDPDTPELLAPDNYLDLHRETGIGLRAIWTLTRQWSEYGDLKSANKYADNLDG